MHLDYYVYAILDPRYSGNIVYLDYLFSHRPIYIGKGRGNRKDFHTFNSRLDTIGGNMLKKNILNKIIHSGLEPIVHILVDNLTEEESFNIEVSLINNIGRRELGTGPLTNLTDGGEGQSGSLSFIGEKNPFYDKKHTLLTRTKLSKPIIKLSLEGDALKSYPSITSACVEMGIKSDSKLRDCLKGRTKTYKGFLWRYVNELHTLDTQVHSISNFNYISQKSLDDIEIARWESISSILNSFDKIHKSNLIDCLKGRKNTCNGYRWEYQY